jgi:hypothetical protein
MSEDVLIGGCQCGRVRYRVEPGPTRLVVCHCLMCQKQSGSAFGMSLGMSPRAFQLTEGELKTFDVTCDSGRIKTCAFCPGCGTRIYNQTSGRMSIKAGTLDDTSSLRPVAHYWTKRKQPWVTIPEGVDACVDDG